MKILNQKTVAATLSFTVLALPVVVHGAGLIPNCGEVVNGKFVDCTFNDVLKLANNIIHFLLYDVSVPLAALGFMWAGAGLILNQDKDKARSDAKKRFTNIGIGFGIMLGSYVLIKVVIYAFLNTDAGFYTFLMQ